MTTAPEDRQETALHEARHCVVAEILVPGAVKWVRIVPEDTRMGLYKLNLMWPIREMMKGISLLNVITLRAVIILAGPYPYMTSWDGQQIQRLHLNELQQQRAQDGVTHLLMDSDVKGLVHNVSHELDESGTLSGPQVRRIISSQLQPEQLLKIRNRALSTN